MSDLVTFANLLHEHQRLDAPQIRQFLDKHRNDEEFMARVEVLQKLFAMRRDISRDVTATLKKQ